MLDQRGLGDHLLRVKANATVYFITPRFDISHGMPPHLKLDFTATATLDGV